MIFTLLFLAQVAGDLNFTPDTGHVIQVEANAYGPGGYLALRAGHGIGQGGTLDLMAGNALYGGIPGSIGIGRVDGSARDITIGRLDSPGYTLKSYFRGANVFVDARETMSLRAPEIILDANSQDGLNTPGILRLMSGSGTGIRLSAGSTNLEYKNAVAIQAYAGGVIVQKVALGKLAFFGETPVTRPVVTGCLSDGTATASLIQALNALGLIDDLTTP